MGTKMINVKQVKRCVTCKLWHGDAAIDYNAKLGLLRFDDCMKAHCDFWRADRQSIHTCPKHQLDFRYI